MKQQGLGLAGAAGEPIELYTDGACSGNPGPGGWAWVKISDGVEAGHDGGGEAMTTNNRMEMSAVIEALESFPSPAVLHVYTDSTYVTNGVDKWMAAWKRRSWLTASKKPVANQDLWKRLDLLLCGRSVRFFWTKGHADSHGNILADRYAQRQARAAAADRA